MAIEQNQPVFEEDVQEKNYLIYNFDRDGFVTKIHDNRLWVFKTGSKELGKFEKDGEIAKHVIIPAGGPFGVTVKAPDKETIEEYMSLR